LLKNFLVCKGAKSRKKAAGGGATTQCAVATQSAQTTHFVALAQYAATTQNAPYHTKYPKFLQQNVNFKRFEIHLPT
jgi:hypothetical protein